MKDLLEMLLPPDRRLTSKRARLTSDRANDLIASYGDVDALLFPKGKNAPKTSPRPDR